MGDSSTSIEVSYTNASDSIYEIKISTPTHFSAVIDHIDTADGYIKNCNKQYNIPLSTIKPGIEGQKQRYDFFGPIYESFFGIAAGIDQQLATSISNTFGENLDASSDEQLQDLINNYFKGEGVLDWSDLKNLGLSDSEISALLQGQMVLNSLQGCSKEEALQKIQDAIKEAEDNNDGVLITILNALKDQYIKDPATFMLNIADSDTAKIYMTTMLTKITASLTFEEQEKITAKIFLLEKKLNNLNLSIESGKTHGSMRVALKHQKEKIQLINKESEKYANLTDDIAKASKVNGWVIGGSIVALQLALEFYDSYVTNGMSWDDALQNVGTSAIGIAGATAVSTVTEGAFLFFGMAAGPAGWVAIGAGVVFSVFYDMVVKDWVHTKFEEGEDWWEQQQW